MEDTQNDSNRSNDVTSDTTAEGEDSYEDEVESTAAVLVQESKPLERSRVPSRREGDDSNDQKSTEKAVKQISESDFGRGKVTQSMDPNS